MLNWSPLTCRHLVSFLEAAIDVSSDDFADIGYMINHAMFQRNGRIGYVLKPPALRQHAPKELLDKWTLHTFDVTIISAQQLPRPLDSSGKEVIGKNIIDPLVEVTLYIPDWPIHPETKLKDKEKANSKSKERGRSHERKDPTHTNPRASSTAATSTPARISSARTSVVKKNGFNPVWEDKLSLPFDCVGDMFDLIFVKFAVKLEDKEADEPLAVYCASLGSLEQGKLRGLSPCERLSDERSVFRLSSPSPS